MHPHPLKPDSHVLLASDTDARLFASLAVRIATARSAAALIRARVNTGRLVLPSGLATSFRLLELSLDDAESDAKGIHDEITGPATAAAE